MDRGTRPEESMHNAVSSGMCAWQLLQRATSVGRRSTRLLSSHLVTLEPSALRGLARNIAARMGPVDRAACPRSFGTRSEAKRLAFTQRRRWRNLPPSDRIELFDLLADAE